MRAKLAIHLTAAACLLLTLFPVISEAGEISYSPVSEDYYFGASVAVSDEYAVVGAYGYNQSAGAAYVYRRLSAEAWSQPQMITLGEDAVYTDKFGASVAVWGADAIIGAPYRDGNTSSTANIGAAYLFEREIAGWTQKGEFLASDAATSDFFGTSVDICGDYAIIGAPYDDDKGPESGSVYIFKQSGTGWVEQTKLVPKDGAGYDYFGASVAISGQGTAWYAIVGAHLHNDSVTNTSFGAAYIFKLEGDTWVQQQKLMADDGAAEDHFGTSVDLSVPGVF